MPTNFSYSPTGARYEPSHIEYYASIHKANSILNKRGQLVREYPYSFCKLLGIYPKLVFKPF